MELKIKVGGYYTWDDTIVPSPVAVQVTKITPSRIYFKYVGLQYEGEADISRPSFLEGLKRLTPLELFLMGVLNENT